MRPTGAQPHHVTLGRRLDWDSAILQEGQTIGQKHGSKAATFKHTPYTGGQNIYRDSRDKGWHGTMRPRTPPRMGPVKATASMAHEIRVSFSEPVVPLCACLSCPMFQISAGTSGEPELTRSPAKTKSSCRQMICLGPWRLTRPGSLGLVFGANTHNPEID